MIISFELFVASPKREPVTVGARHKKSEVDRCWSDVCFKKPGTKASELLQTHRYGVSSLVQMQV